MSVYTHNTKNCVYVHVHHGIQKIKNLKHKVIDLQTFNIYQPTSAITQIYLFLIIICNNFSEKTFYYVNLSINILNYIYYCMTIIDDDREDNELFRGMADWRKKIKPSQLTSS